MKIKLEIRKNDINENGKRKLIAVLVHDLGYRKQVLEFIPEKIAEYLSCSVGKLYTLDIGTYDVGNIYGLNK